MVDLRPWMAALAVAASTPVLSPWRERPCESLMVLELEIL